MQVAGMMWFSRSDSSLGLLEGLVVGLTTIEQVMELFDSLYISGS